MPLSWHPTKTTASVVGCWAMNVFCVIARPRLRGLNVPAAAVGVLERNTPPSQPTHTEPAPSLGNAMVCPSPWTLRPIQSGSACGLAALANPKFGAAPVSETVPRHRERSQLVPDHVRSPVSQTRVGSFGSSAIARSYPP